MNFLFFPLRVAREGESCVFRVLKSHTSCMLLFRSSVLACGALPHIANISTQFSLYGMVVYSSFASRFFDAWKLATVSA